MTTSRQTARSTTAETALPTFMDHVHELKGRFFWVAICFAIASASVYPYFGQIISLLTKPLGDHNLYYLTPAGGLSFVIKICLYLGIIGALPAIVYHLYKFIAPVMPKKNARQVIMYTLSSITLAICGVLFAYFVSLPAAIHFLVNFNINNVSAMLTVDAYFSFVMAYIIAGAVLFQLPLVLLIINSIHRISPKQLMSYQRHNIILSFILAALLSPTPDVVNQSLLALPMVVMYQLGVFLVWMKNRKESRAKKKAARAVAVAPRKQSSPGMFDDGLPDMIWNELPQTAVAAKTSTAVTATALHQSSAPKTIKVRRMDGFVKTQHIKPKTTQVAHKPSPAMVQKPAMAAVPVASPLKAAPVPSSVAVKPTRQSLPQLPTTVKPYRTAPRDMMRPVSRSAPVFTATRRPQSHQRPIMAPARMFISGTPGRLKFERSQLVG